MYERKTPVASEYLGGQSPRARGREKENRVLEWVYRWGHATAEMIRLVGGAKANGYAKRQAERGLLRATKTASGTPKVYYTLTESGLQQVERHVTEPHRYPEIDPYRVNQQQIRHYRIAQQATLQALHKGLIAEFETERMTGEADTAGKKRPDVTWLLDDGSRWGVEIELSAKWDRRLDQFIYDIARALGQGTYTRFCIVTDAPAIETRYRLAFAAKSIPVWGKDSRGRWEQTNVVDLPLWLPQRVDFLLIEVD